MNKRKCSPRFNHVVNFEQYFKMHLDSLKTSVADDAFSLTEDQKSTVEESIKTLRMLLSDRGYDVSSYNIEEIFRCHTTTFNKVNNRKFTAGVWTYFSKSKLGISDARKLLTNLDGHDENIVLLLSDMTPAASALIKSIDPKLRTVCFFCDELVRPLPRHKMVGDMQLIADPDSHIKKLYCKRSQLPVDKKSSPIVRWYGYQKNDIIEMTRHYGGSNNDVKFTRIIK